MADLSTDRLVVTLQFLRSRCGTDIRAALLFMDMNEHSLAWERIGTATSVLNDMVHQALPEGGLDIGLEGAYWGLSPKDAIKAILAELAGEELVGLIALGELSRAAVKLEAMRLGLCELLVLRDETLRDYRIASSGDTASGPRTALV